MTVKDTVYHHAHWQFGKEKSCIKVVMNCSFLRRIGYGVEEECKDLQEVKYFTI